MNDARVIRDKRIVSMSADDVDAVVRVHLTGTFAQVFPSPNPGLKLGG